MCLAKDCWEQVIHPLWIKIGQNLKKEKKNRKKIHESCIPGTLLQQFNSLFASLAILIQSSRVLNTALM